MQLPTASLALAIVLVMNAGGCSDISDDSRGDLVAASVSPITNLVANVGAGAIEVVGLVPEGRDSHTFEPSPSQVRDLSAARILFVNGLGLEEPLIDLALAREDGPEVVELAAQTITRDEWIFDRSFPKSSRHPNPHLWTNPLYAIRFTEVIRDTLTETFPRHSEKFRSNQRTIANKIEELDRGIRLSTDTVPESNRKLVTYHDSFPYFAREYGWKVIGAIQPSDFSEPTPGEVTRLIEQVRSEAIPAIFGSEVFPSKVLEQIAQHSGARYIDDLRDDDLPGDAGDPDHSYLGLMKADLVIMVEALGGDAASIRKLDVADLPRARASYAG